MQIYIIHNIFTYLLEVDRVDTLLIHYWEDGRIYMPSRHKRSTNHATTLSRITYYVCT